MTIMEMLRESAVLTVFGVGIVFSFLILLVISITLLSKIIRALDSSKNAQVKGTATADAAVQTRENGPIIAAITAAVTEYRKSHA